jgi:type 1 glutamine amidotransferase
MPIMRRSFLLGALAAPAALPQSRKLSALVIDGINNHDWQAGTKVIRSVLESTGRFTVEVSTSPPKGAPATDWEAWRPRFQGRDVVVNNFNGGHLADGVRWPRPVEEAFETYVRHGGGFVSFHAANNAFLEWDDYNEMIGLGWRDKGFGPGLIVDEKEKVVSVPAGEGLGPGHGPAHTFTMTMMDPRHAITAGMPKQWLHPTEQLTHGQHAPAQPKDGAIEKELRILTYALSKDSHRREPMDWVRSWGRGRIYVTMLGHTWRDQDNPNCRCAGFETLFARGVEWAASGKVTIPMPARFPGPESVVFG